MSTTMKGKRVVITGPTKGIGRVAAVELAKKGADMTLVARDEGRARELANEIGGADVFIGDLSSIAEVKRLGDEIAKRHERIDVLVNNAGAINMGRETTVDGLERTFATNHLAYFVLTDKLLPSLKNAASAGSGARIVNVASEAHRQGSIDFDDLMFEKRWSGMNAYFASKLANILFTAELARRLEGTKVTANSLHPGAVASGFMANNTGIVALGWKVISPLLLSTEKGAKTTIFLASDPSVEGVTGKYFQKCKERKPSRKARDMTAANRLWQVSEDLVR
jgi:NAD(P)-dependent dehydrogenase (short-subunit alcohol dehydrogenase family)